MKKVFCLFLSLFLAATACMTVFAVGDPVFDEAELLYSTEIALLNSKANEIAHQYSITIRILTVDSLSGKTAQSFADDYYDRYLLDLTDGNGILLVVAITDREWAVTTNGDTVSVITDSDIDDIMEEVQPELSYGNYYEAFDLFLEEIQEEYAAKASEPWFRILCSLLIGALAGGITLLVMRSGMKTAVQQHGAGSYMVESSYDLFQCRDIFLYSHTSKVRKPENNGSSGSGRSHGGGSRGGRSGRF